MAGQRLSALETRRVLRSGLPFPKGKGWHRVPATPKQHAGRQFEAFLSADRLGGQTGLDIVCLGEAITQVGRDPLIKDCAEPIPLNAAAR